MQYVRSFLSWNQLRKAIREKQHTGEKEAEMITDSKIQTFRMYQTFGENIPNLVIATACIANLESKPSSDKNSIEALFKNFT